MKNYFDSFYEIIHKNSVKRRRMVSLLLVLSVFVSSGVLWELHDTVITMVNEPLCAIAEHEHTDECYEYRLVCGLDENEEHTHTEECYEKVLVCGNEEHLHTTLCYTGEELPGSSDKSDNEESNIVSIDLPEEEDEEMLLEQLDPAAAAEFRLGKAMRASLANDPTELESPSGVSTIDNIARGINITLFDYHDTENELESKLNNYDIVRSGSAWIHPHYDGNTYKSGWKDVGINSGRNPDDDIMFFAYGTPDFTGTIGDGDDGNSYNIYTRTPIDQISKNNYSGDYNTNSTYTSQLSGNRPIQGIVKNQLSAAGYPVMNNTAAHSLDYLFSETPSAYKTVYTGVNHFLQDINGHLVYNSNNNYAYYNEDTHDFTVYESTYHIINRDHHRDKDYNNLTDVEYDGANGGEFKIGFFPFDQYDLTRRDPNFNGNGFNHHFGMKMDARFKNLGAPTEPIVFKYSGDDDMWVFVDDVLVLDIGGIHEPAAGMIDFTNGLVWTQDNALGSVAETAYNNLRSSNPGLPVYADIPKPDNGVNTDGASESKWKVETLASKFAGIEGKSCDARDNKAHTIEMFYLERGGCYSNLAIDMNLPTVRPLTVTKDVDFRNHYSNDYDRTDDANCPTYQFAVYVEDPVDSGTYVLADLGEPNPFRLKDGERKDFYLADETRKYYVVENGIDPNIYSSVLVNAAARPIESGSAVSGTPAALNVTDSYNFTNIVRQEETTLNVTKTWLNPSGTAVAGPTGHPVKFKLFRSDNGGEPQPVEINGKMTFTLSSPGWTWTPTDTSGNPIELPTRYGDHFYTYSVEELNVPDGYVASYGTDQYGNPTITNKDVTNVDIHVQKNWINTATADKTNIRLVLKRERAPYAPSQATSLRINLRDAAGNLLSTYEVGSDEDKIYAGGSVEFAFTAPNGVEYYPMDSAYPKCVPNTVEVDQISDRTFEISNLAPETDPSVIANEVDIKIYTDEAEDSLLLLHHSFSQWTDGWIPNGGSEILTSSYNAYAKGDGMLIRGPGNTDRTASNQGARYDLDPQIFKVNHTYTFSTYVRYDEDVGVEETVGGVTKKYVIFKFTLYDGLENGDASYSVIEQTKVYSGEWTHLMGTVTLPPDINPYGMYIIVESFDPPGQPFIGPSRFRMDEFAAIEGNHAINVEETTGKLTVGSGEYSAVTNGTAVYEHNTMQNYDSSPKNWYKFGGEVKLDSKNYESSYAVVVSNRKSDWQGVAKKVTLTPGQKYHHIAQVAGNHTGNDSTTPHTIQATLTYTDTNNKSQYIPLGSVDTKGNQWGTIDAVFDLPTDVDTSKDIVIYYNTTGTEDFEVWSSRLYEAIENTDLDKAGYTLSGGTYTSNYSQYGLVLDSDSATNPLNLTSAFTEDTSFSRPVTLSEADNWKYHWTKGDGADDIQEASGYRYRYYIEEQWIGDSSNTVGYDSTENIWKSSDEGFIVSYSGNMVETNDEDNPIIVNNRSIRYRLPETGGGGRGRIYFFGTLLTAIGIISGSALYRRRRRRI
ncbi:MAG: carbohydrate binding domain-containing protein [Ruminococcus sp.]|nr:carbohydrate binding domain-containing protein [Ruminococcus sp.]